MPLFHELSEAMIKTGDGPRLTSGYLLSFLLQLSQARCRILYLGYSTPIRPHITPTSPDSPTRRIIDSLYDLSSASYRPRPSLSHGNIMAHTYASDFAYFSCY